MPLTVSQSIVVQSFERLIENQEFDISPNRQYSTPSLEFLVRDWQDAYTFPIEAVRSIFKL